MFFLLQNWRTGGQNRFCPEGAGVGTGRMKRWQGKGKEGEYGANNVYTCT
jgi:hypothetical protein